LIGPSLADETDRQAPRGDDLEEKIGQLNIAAAGYAVSGRVLASGAAKDAPALSYVDGPDWQVFFLTL
jgi:hypothetical protein